MTEFSGFISTLKIAPGTSDQLEDGIDNIHSGIIKALNVADAGSFIAHGFQVTSQLDGTFDITAGGYFDKGEYKTLGAQSNLSSSDFTGASAFAYDWYGFIVINSSGSIAFRGDSTLGASAAKTADLNDGDIPICVVQIGKGTGNNSLTAARKIQYFGVKRLKSVLSVGEEVGSSGDYTEKLKINSDGTVQRPSNSGKISFPAVGSTDSTLYSTNDAGIGDGNVLVANANVSDNDFLKVDGTSIEGRTATELKSDLSLVKADVGLGNVTNESKATMFTNPTFTGTIAIPNISDLESAVAANTAKTVRTDSEINALAQALIDDLVDSAPTTLDTLNELAAALGDDANFATTTSTSLGNRLRIDINNQNLTSTQLSNVKANLSLAKADVGLSNVLNQAQITTFVSDNAPTATAIGDLWIDSNDDNKMYRATATGSSNWVAVTLGKGALGLVKADVGLGNVDNKSSATIRSEIVASDIPSLDTSKITTGTFADGRISKSSVIAHSPSATKSDITDLGSDLDTANDFMYVFDGSASDSIKGATISNILGKITSSELVGSGKVFSTLPASGAEVNVQSNWNETDNTSDSFIQNKPTIPSGNQIIDWTQDQGSTNINPGNYINTNQLTTFNIDVDNDNNSTTIAHGETLTFTGGTGISTETTADGTITFTNDSPDQTVSLTGSGATSVSGTYPNFTISSTDTNTTYSTATSSALGLVKIGYSENGKNYPVELDSGQMYVNVPWTNTNQLTTFTLRGTTNTNATTVNHGDTITIAAGTGITTTSTSDGTITVASTLTSNATHTGDVTGSTTLTIADDAVTYAKMQDVSATSRVLGRITAGSGDVEELTGANLRSIINVENGATADQTDSEIETAYNNQVSQVTSTERTNGTETGIRRYAPADIKSMIDTHQTDTVYSHPSHDGDDIDIDTTALTGATVISDLDLNITTDTLGHVTDANASIATRNLTLADLGFTGDSDATDDQTGAEIKTALFSVSDTNNLTDTLLSKLNAIEANATADQTASEITDLLNDVASYSLGTSSSGTITVNNDMTVAGDLVVTGTTTTTHVETTTTSNGVVFEGSVDDANDLTLKAGTVSGTRTVILPDASGTVAVSASGGIALSSTGDITANLSASHIPNLDASKINTGTLGTDRIPSLATSKITSGTFANALIAESNVTQHEAALSITESQISDLGSYLTISNNLSDLNNAGTARTNLGLGTAATKDADNTNGSTTGVANDNNNLVTGNAIYDYIQAQNFSQSGQSNFVIGDITGQSELTSGLQSTDELVLSDGGSLARMDISVLESYMQNNLTFTTNTDTQLSNEQVQDIAGPLVATGGTKTRISVTYQDSTNDIDFVVDDMNFSVSDITGATALTSGLASTDELVLSDAGVLKRMDISVLEDYIHQPNATTATGAASSTDHYAKLLTFNPGGQTTRDCNLILAVTAHDQGAVGSAIISVKFRSNAATTQYTADVAFMSKSGTSIFDEDAFQIFSDGNLVAQDNNTDMELWVKKNNNYSSLEVHELSKAITGGSATLTYHTASAWQSSAPTNNAFTTTTQGIELNLDVIRMGTTALPTYLYLNPHSNSANSFLLATTAGDVTLAADDDLVLHADDDILFQAGAATKMTLLNTGELGIGTTTPDGPLHIYHTDNTGVPGITIETAGGDSPSDSILRIKENHGSPTWVDFTVNTFGQLEITGGATTRRQIFTADEPDTDASGVISLNKDHYEWDTQIFGDSSTPVIYVDGTNNRMGVGTTSPAVNLHVADASDPKIRVQDTTDNYSATLAGYSGGAYLALGDMDSGESNWMLLGAFSSINNLNTRSRDFHLYGTNTTTGFYFDESAGRFGIGTTSPEGVLEIEQATTTGHALKVYRNQTASNMDSSLVFLHDDSQYADEAVLHVKQDGTGVGILVEGSLQATTKSFDIEHPTKEGMRLHHGSLEGPEHGVYIRGRLEGNEIDLPDYWLGLVDEDTITVQLTPNKGFQQIYVEDISDNKVYVGTQSDKPIDCFYFIQAERKDVDKMEVEY